MNYKSIFSVVGVVAAVSFFCIGCSGKAVNDVTYREWDNDLNEVIVVEKPRFGKMYYVFDPETNEMTKVRYFPFRLW